MSISLPMEEEVEYFTDPEQIHDMFGDMVDMVIDGGPGGIVPSTVVDCSAEELILIREGAGVWDEKG